MILLQFFLGLYSQHGTKVWIDADEVFIIRQSSDNLYQNNLPGIFTQQKITSSILDDSHDDCIKSALIQK